VQAGSRSHPGSYPIDTRDSVPEVKWPGNEAGHSHLFIVEVKNVGAKPPFPHMPSWRDAKLIKYRDEFTLLYLTYF
jgi:hypothetical protein